MQANSKQRTSARHQVDLKLEALVSGAVGILAEQGILSVIIPYDNFSTYQELISDKGLIINSLLKVRPTPEKEFKRILVEASFSHTESVAKEISIELGRRHDYSKDYMELTREFYLKF